MKLFAVLLTVLPTFTFAEEIVLAGKVTDVTIFPQGAMVTRNIPFQATAGAHKLIITGLPRDSMLETPQISVSGAILGVVTLRNDYVPPQDEAENPAMQAVEAEIDAIEGSMRATMDQISEASFENDSTAARIAFLRQIGEGDKLAESNLERLRDLTRMIGEETLAARLAGHKADLAIRDLKDTLEERQEDLVAAKARLAALVPEAKEYDYLAVQVTSDEAINGVLSISSFADASWMPTYEFHLTTDDDPELNIVRGAMVQQITGENWQGVRLTLSTTQPLTQRAPSEVYGWQRRIEKPAPAPSLARYGNLGAPAPEPMMVVAEAAMAEVDYDGFSVNYIYPQAIDIASGADIVRLVMGEMQAEPAIFAHAAPLYDSVAFLLAEFTNTTGEIILPTQEAAFFLNGRSVGTAPVFEVIPNGGDMSLSFGPIEGVRLTHRVVDRNEGDTGFVSRVNEVLELAEIGIENLTDRAWDVRLLDRVPYSEQEDLVITWRAKPVPSAVDIEGRRGVLQWDFTLAPQERKDITLSHRIEWPSGMELR